MLLMITKAIVDTRRARYRGVTAATTYGRRSAHVGITPVVIRWNATANIIIQSFSAIKIARTARLIMGRCIISYQIFAKFVKNKISRALHNDVYQIMHRQQIEQITWHGDSNGNPSKQKTIQADNIHFSIFSNLLLLFHKSHLHKFLQTILSLTSFSQLNQLFPNIFNIKSIIGQSQKGECHAALRA